MSEFGLVAYILLIFGIASFLAMREKVLPLNQASAVKNLILVILGDLLLMFITGFSELLTFWLFFTMMGEFSQKISDKALVKKMLFTGFWGCFGLIFIAGEQNIFMDFPFDLTNLAIVGGGLVIITLAIYPLSFIFQEGDKQINLKHWGLMLFLGCILAGSCYLIGDLLLFINNFGYSLLANGIGFALQMIFPILAIYYRIRFPKYVPPSAIEPKLGTNIENASVARDATSNSRSEEDEPTEVHMEAKYSYHGFIAPDRKSSNPPDRVTYELPTECPVCKESLMPEGICANCQKKICPRCYNLNPIRAYNCTCGYVFDISKKRM